LRKNPDRGIEVSAELGMIQDKQILKPATPSVTIGSMKPKRDPVVAEVRANRRKLSEKFGFDVRKLIADARSRQAKSGHRLVSFLRGSPKRS
jgi:hypothetical protein